MFNYGILAVFVLAFTLASVINLEKTHAKKCPPGKIWIKGRCRIAKNAKKLRKKRCPKGKVWFEGICQQVNHAKKKCEPGIFVPGHFNKRGVWVPGECK